MGFICIKFGGGGFALLILSRFFLINTKVSLIPNYFIFIGYLKTGDRGGGGGGGFKRTPSGSATGLTKQNMWSQEIAPLHNLSVSSDSLKKQVIEPGSFWAYL